MTYIPIDAPDPNPEPDEEESASKESSWYTLSSRLVGGKLEYTVEAHYLDSYQERRSHFREIPVGLAVLQQEAICDQCGASADSCGGQAGVTERIVFGDPGQQPFCD